MSIASLTFLRRHLAVLRQTFRACGKSIFKRRRIFVMACVCLCAAVNATGQSQQNAQFTQGTPGTNTMTFQVPLGSFPGRGVDLPLNLNYNSKVWRIGFLKSRYWTPNGKNAVAEAIYSEFATAGWTTSLDVPVVEWPKVQDLYWYTGKPYANGSVYPYTFRVARVYIHMPDGAVHELRKADAVQQDTGSVDTNGTFYAVDNSRLRYDASGATNGVLYLPDGSRYSITSTTVQYIDRNGNTLTYSVSNRQWTDTMGRTIGMPWPSNPQAGVSYQYSVPGFNGNPVTYTLKFAQLSSALSPNSGMLMPVGDWYLPNPSLPPGDYNSANNPQSQSGPTMFHSAYTDPDEMDYRTYTQVIGRGQPGNTNFNAVVLTEVVLPNSLSYKFSYNNYGEIDKIIYPSGAYQRYEYGLVAALGYPVPPYGATRGLKNRWLSASGTGTDEVQWNYSFEGPFVLVLTAPGPTGAANGIQTKTYIYNQPNPQNNFGYDDALNGMAYEQRVYAPAVEGGALLRRTLTKWDKSSGTYNRPSPGTGTYTPSRNPRALKTVSIWLDTGGNALTTTTTFDYDMTYWWNVGLDRTSSSEYGFTLTDQNTAQNGVIDSIPLGSLVRTTNTAYTTSDPNYRNRNILGLPTSSSISDASGFVSQTLIDYDQSSYPLISVGPVVGWNDPLTTYRGNPTSVRRWLNYPSVTWIQTHTQYDQFGNVRKTWDGMGRLDPSTDIDYSPAYYYAYPTTISTIAPDPSGMYGQPTPLVKTTVFDINTGLVTSSTDANGRTTSFEYNDPLYRQTKVTRPDGGWTAVSYNDDPANTFVRTQVLQHTTPSQQVLESYQYFDKLGRSVRSFANEGTTYLTTDTQYDFLGRLWRTSNPYRTTAPSLNSGVNPSNQWTTNSYDSQNRVTSVTTADNAHVNSSFGYSLVTGYLGTTVTVSDQMGRARKSLTDGAGRVIQVVEDPNSLAYQTNYTYDAMNNLRKVAQGNQLRYFGYDSLSRVIFVRQVEQTVNTSLPAWTDPVTGYSGGWNAAFSYDNNGNTLTRTDARNITATLTFDQLNRVTTLRYSNDPQNTPGVDTYYDGYRGNNYTAINNVKGKAWQTETIGQVRFTIDNFDVIGRPTIQRQQFWTSNAWSNSYQTSVNFDLAGGLTSQTYPSGRTVAYDYDQLGRLQNFSGNLGGTLQVYANNFQYNDYGFLQQERFGTQTPLYHKQRFNSRGQLWDMRLSTVSFDGDPANGDRGSIVNYFSTGYAQGASGTDNNGNLLRQEIYVPSGPYFQQTYNYDNLNRLTSVSEKQNGAGADSFKQLYTYDRWGNRSVDTALSSANVPRPAYTVDTNTNRLIAPAGSTFAYDNAGNQTNDTYTGSGQRTFDAENHMASAQGSTGWQYYKYSGSGLRVRRIVNGVEIWQIFGLGGTLLAEYPASGAAANPQTEYGYRNGQLLITASSNGVQWLVMDQLGTPRMAVDQSGALASVKRHDYLPFGEEIGGPQVGLIGGRMSTLGYVADSARQKFTGYEFDVETGLNYAQARYQSSVQGRFTSVDPLGASADIGDPQSFNRYSYVQNMPLTAVDPTGMALSDMGIYQTNNPEVAELLYKNSLPRPEQHRKNPTLPKPRPVKVDPNKGPPPPGGPVPTTISPIDVGPAPLPNGEEPWPTSLVVTQTNNKVYNGDPLISPSGEIIDSQPHYGIGRTLDYTVLDQAGNPMSAGVLLRESVTPANQQAQALMPGVNVNPDPQKPNNKGIVPDTVGAISDKPGIFGFLNRNQLNAEFTQTITIFGTFGKEYRTAMTLTNTYRLTNSGVTVTIGTVQQHQRPN